MCCAFIAYACVVMHPGATRRPDERPDLGPVLEATLRDGKMRLPAEVEGAADVTVEDSVWLS